jgi:hypothetical protein
LDGDENKCKGKCSEIYPTQNEHIKQRVGILGSNGQFCAAFYHVHQWYHRKERRYREHFCLDEDNCIVAKEAKGHIKKFVDDAKEIAKTAKKFAEEADDPQLLEKEAVQLAEEAEKLAEKQKISSQEVNEFVKKARKSSAMNLFPVQQLAETAHKAVYAWCVQVKTVVAVVKLEDENGIIVYEARYTNCGKEQKHAEDFFKEDIEKGKLKNKVEANPNGTITMYLTIQPCNESTSTGGRLNTPAKKSCCETLKTIFNDILWPKNITLCVKPTNTCRLSLTTEKVPNDEILRQKAVAGIEMLMGIGVNVSGMTREDWHYLLSLTNELENNEDLEVHEDRQDLDGCVQNIFNQIQDQIN